MAPLLLSAASLAGNLIHHLASHFSHPKIRKATVVLPPDFAAELAKTQSPPATGSVQAPSTGTVLTQRVLGSPEVASALAKVDPAKAVQLEMSAGGDVALRGANGTAHALKISEGTRGLVAQLYASHQPAPKPGQVTRAAVLAVDPARTTSAAWSALPPRSA